MLYYAGKLFIEAPKTKQGVRTIPMSAKAKEAFEHMIAIRPRLDKEPVVDGYSGFFQITPYGKPRRTPSVEANLKKIIMKYNESHPQDTLRSSPRIHSDICFVQTCAIRNEPESHTVYYGA